MKEIRVSFLAVIAVTCSLQAADVSQTAREILGPPAVVPLTEEPSADLNVDPPRPDALANGRVVIQFRTENLRPVPVFGPAAAAILPRIGHLHVNVDDARWIWAHTSGEELIIVGLSPGPHKVTMNLESANHSPLAKRVVNFEVPSTPATMIAPKAGEASMEAGRPSEGQPPAKIIVDPPQAARLAKGVVFIEYRAENLQIAPVFGLTALAVSPRIGHVHITVDDAPWHWADASGGPVIINGLPPGPHKVEIVLADPTHRPIDRAVVEVVIPGRNTAKN
jgi:hypothetical protein